MVESRDTEHGRYKANTLQYTWPMVEARVMVKTKTIIETRSIVDVDHGIGNDYGREIQHDIIVMMCSQWTNHISPHLP